MIKSNKDKNFNQNKNFIKDNQMKQKENIMK